MDIWITGGAWITPNGYGSMGEGKVPVLGSGFPVMPPDSDLFPHPHPRYGRFDMYTKLGCSAVALAMKNAGYKEGAGDEPVGMVVSTIYEVMETDIAYYQTTLEQGGVFSSPNLFSYTLPVIVLGECAVLFHLTGPTFCVGESSAGPGMSALQNAASMIVCGKTNKMLAGWIDSPPPGLAVTETRLLTGAIFVMLDTRPDNVLSFPKTIVYDRGKLTVNKDREISSIADLFIHEE